MPAGTTGSRARARLALRTEHVLPGALTRCCKIILRPTGPTGQGLIGSYEHPRVPTRSLRATGPTAATGIYGHTGPEYLSPQGLLARKPIYIRTLRLKCIDANDFASSVSRRSTPVASWWRSWKYLSVSGLQAYAETGQLCLDPRNEAQTRDKRTTQSSIKYSGFLNLVVDMVLLFISNKKSTLCLRLNWGD